MILAVFFWADENFVAMAESGNIERKRPSLDTQSADAKDRWCFAVK
jgi:hypothetical protein